MHVLITGRTATGKTTLARRLAKEYKRPSLILDPLASPWPNGFVFVRADEFLKAAASHKNCNLFVDESGEVIGQHEREMFWLATRARHRGHLSHFLTQRPSQVSPTVRGQCAHLFTFKIGPKDAALLAEEFVAPSIAEDAPNLPLGVYLYVAPDGKISRGHVWQVSSPARHIAQLRAVK